MAQLCSQLQNLPICSGYLCSQLQNMPIKFWVNKNLVLVLPRAKQLGLNPCKKKPKGLWSLQPTPSPLLGMIMITDSMVFCMASLKWLAHLCSQLHHIPIKLAHLCSQLQNIPIKLAHLCSQLQNKPIRLVHLFSQFQKIPIKLAHLCSHWQHVGQLQNRPIKRPRQSNSAMFYWPPIKGEIVGSGGEWQSGRVALSTSPQISDSPW